MKIQVISDTHFEFFGVDDFDVFLEKLTGGVKKSRTILCIAGDVGVLHRPETWQQALRELARRYRAVICIPGNHEYYNNSLFGHEEGLLQMYRLPKNVHFLVDQTLDLDDVTFIGATLWTSFNGRDTAAMRNAAMKMNDFVRIRHSDGSALTPAQTVTYHERAKEFIFAQIVKVKERSQKVVVLTHHGISPKSVHPKYQHDPITAAFITDLEQEILTVAPELWVHGHTHHSFAYMIGPTRVICNPLGYLHREENPKFDFNLKIEV